MNQPEKYTIILRWSEQQRAYTGQVQELVGVEGSGKTYEEALAATLEAIRWWRKRSGEGSSSPFSQMLMKEPAEPEENEPEENSPAVS